MNIFLLTILSIFWNQNTEHPLKKYRWENRIIILSAKRVDSLYNKQLEVLEAQQKDLLDRDLLIVLLDESHYSIGKNHYYQSSDVKAIRKFFDIPADRFSLTLIGKDGTVKLQNNSLTDPENIFEIIDGMPMRRLEMRRSRKY